MILNGLDVVIQIKPYLVKKGEHIKIRGKTPGFTFVFHDDEDRLGWMDRIEEEIFELNHPVRKVGSS